MQRIIALLLIIVLSIMCINCSKQETATQDNTPKYAINDVRNRNLKDAIEYFNKGYYKASATSIVNARNQRLRDEDIEIMHDLNMKIDQKTADAILALETLALDGEPHNYDFEYNTIHSNYDVSDYRQKIDGFSKKYLARIKKENDTYLETYFKYIDELKSKTNLTLENYSKIYVSKTSPMKVKIVIDRYKTPQLYFEFKPSQKEPELETLKFSSSTLNIFFDKNELVINDYNLSASKIISFNLLDPNSKVTLTNLKQLFEGNRVQIDLKWFYEPERINISSKTINTMQDILSSFDKILAEYKANEKNIYVPKYVK
jgi:hypothetical protein